MYTLWWDILLLMTGILQVGYYVTTGMEQQQIHYGVGHLLLMPGILQVGKGSCWSFFR